MQKRIFLFVNTKRIDRFKYFFSSLLWTFAAFTSSRIRTLDFNCFSRNNREKTEIIANVNGTLSSLSRVYFRTKNTTRIVGEKTVSFEVLTVGRLKVTIEHIERSTGPSIWLLYFGSGNNFAREQTNNRDNKVFRLLYNIAYKRVRLPATTYLILKRRIRRRPSVSFDHHWRAIPAPYVYI